jgi:two-component system chemotaxis response regulator CheY
MTNLERTYWVLVADDSPVSRKLLEHALEEGPFSLLQARNGSEALDLFGKHNPEIVISDWVMPDFSGPELCKRIRANGQRGYTYIILLTSNREKESIVEGLAAGADDYLTKPFDEAELLARIGVGRRIIELHREIDAKNKQLEELAHTDPLTGLPNRRAIEEWAERQLHGAARHGFPFWAVLTDLDGFKRINDTYGHEAGDVVLKKFAEILKTQTRAADMCGRLGGDEFVLVMTHVEAKDIQRTLDRLREKIAAESFSFGSMKARVTGSFGVSGFQGKELPKFNMLVGEADKALYEAKRAGGNQVKVNAPKRG